MPGGTLFHGNQELRSPAGLIKLKVTARRPGR
jgi:hypothetical protein